MSYCLKCGEVWPSPGIFLLGMLLLCLNGGCGGGLKPIPPSEPMQPHKAGHLQLSVPESLKPDPDASIYGWWQSDKDDLRIYMLEQLNPIPDTPGQGFAAVWERIHNHHAAISDSDIHTTYGRAYGRNRWDGDVSDLFGAPARYDFCPPIYLHVLVQKEGALLHLVHFLHVEEPVIVQRYDNGADEEQLRRREVEPTDFRPRPGIHVQKALQVMADIARRWHPRERLSELAGAAASEARPNVFYTVLGGLDESPRCPLAFEFCYCLFRDKSGDIALSVQSCTSVWPSDYGWAEKNERDYVPDDSGGGVSGLTALAALGYLIFTNPIDFFGNAVDALLTPDPPGPLVLRDEVRELNGMYGLEEVIHDKKEAWPLNAVRTHFGNYLDPRLPRFVIRMRGKNISQPEVFLGLWDSIAASVRPSDSSVQPGGMRETKRKLHYGQEEGPNISPRGFEGRAPRMAGVRFRPFFEGNSCLRAAFGAEQK